VAVDDGSEVLDETSADSILEWMTEQVRAQVRTAAELATSAELYRMTATEAMAYLSAPETQAALRESYVSEETIAEALAIVEAAVSTGEAVTGVSGGEAAKPSTQLVGGVAAIVLGLGALAVVAQQQGLLGDVGTTLDVATTALTTSLLA